MSLVQQQIVWTKISDPEPSKLKKVNGVRYTKKGCCSKSEVTK